MKGRLIIPSRFRSDLQKKYIDRFYLTQGLDGCIEVYTESEWKLRERKLKLLPLESAKARSYSRMLFSQTREATCDDQGRIKIPENLLTWASIDRRVVIIGVQNRFEIWDEGKWNAYRSEVAPDFEKIAESLAGETAAT